MSFKENFCDFCCPGSRKHWSVALQKCLLLQKGRKPKVFRAGKCHWELPCHNRVYGTYSGLLHLDTVSMAGCCVSVESQIKLLPFCCYLLVSRCQIKLRVVGMLSFYTRIFGEKLVTRLSEQERFHNFAFMCDRRQVCRQKQHHQYPGWSRWEGRKRQDLAFVQGK